jgi:hypothetical protein
VSTTFRFPRLWRALGIALIAVVVLGSLLNIAPTLPTQGGDKLNHLLAYGTLMGWWGMVQPRRRLAWALGLLVLGGALEFTQSLTPNRYMEWQDAVANAAGVLLALVLLRTPISAVLTRFDRYLADRLDARGA